MTDDSTIERLTDQQKQRVADNLALVGLQLRRHRSWTGARIPPALRDPLFHE
ncbi:MAG: hypothetical protein IID40_02795, partial [Planctomycetes bacterium]|nr:hypothetical protein [Planctomycetota bacterium]